MKGSDFPKKSFLSSLLAQNCIVALSCRDICRCSERNIRIDGIIYVPRFPLLPLPLLFYLNSLLMNTVQWRPNECAVQLGSLLGDYFMSICHIKANTSHHLSAGDEHKYFSRECKKAQCIVNPHTCKGR